VDAGVSATRVAARAFVGAAVDERALRPFDLDEIRYLAMRFELDRELEASEVEAWRAAGVRILALRHGGGPTLAPSEVAGGLAPGDHTVLAGPAEAIRALVLPRARNPSTP
jgi:hypothetical protein